MKTPKYFLRVLITSQKGILYNGQAKAISSINKKGPFDILPLHTNFISLIYKTIKINSSGKKIKEFKLNTGVLRVKNNTAEAILD